MKASVKWKVCASDAKRYTRTKYRDVLPGMLWSGRERVSDTIDFTFRSYDDQDRIEHFEIRFCRSDEKMLRHMLRTINDYLDNPTVKCDTLSSMEVRDDKS